MLILVQAVVVHISMLRIGKLYQNKLCRDKSFLPFYGAAKIVSNIIL